MIGHNKGRVLDGSSDFALLFVISPPLFRMAVDSGCRWLTLPQATHFVRNY
jgi:hypothetical protein